MSFYWTNSVRFLNKRFVSMMFGVSVAYVVTPFIISAHSWLLGLDWGLILTPAWVQAIGSVAAIFTAVAVAIFSNFSRRSEERRSQRSAQVLEYKATIQLAIRVKDLAQELLQWGNLNLKFDWKDSQHFEHSVDFLLLAMERKMEQDTIYQRWFGCLELHELLRDLRSMLKHYEITNHFLLEHVGILLETAEANQDAWSQDLIELLR